MATLDELKLTHRLFMKGYPFRRYAAETTPCTPLPVALTGARVALVTSAGLRLPEQTAFDHTLRTGDASFREIPTDTQVTRLVEDHKSNSFDHAGIQADANLALPLDRFRELETQGVIGTLNQRHFSFMGSIIGPRRLIDETAPAVAQLLKDDGVDVVFLTPVWPMCVQTVGLLQNAIEKAGITTVSISLLREVTETLHPPRALFVPFPFGYPLGEPDNIPLQQRVIRQALSLLTRSDVPFISNYKA